ncbi:MAG: 2-oxoacid:acceptor oxidoreductase family protein, partial [bacterium]|nr:2-oxoacid:acceptor oxidoreductase family protein [bacterium]
MAITEVRWHARAGQGAVTAAKVLAEATMAQGGYVQAFPDYGPERMGAPLRAYNRISDTPLTMHCAVTNPRVVIVVDSSLLDTQDVTEGTAKDALFLVNSSHTAKEVAKKLGRSAAHVYTVDATQISIDCLGRPIPNTPLLGALARVSGLVELDVLLADLEANLKK